MGLVSVGKFKCPRCGEWKWGTILSTSKRGDWVGECHGDERQAGCGFTWRRTEDKKYICEARDMREDKDNPDAAGMITVLNGVPLENPIPFKKGEIISYSIDLPRKTSRFVLPDVEWVEF